MKESTTSLSWNLISKILLNLEPLLYLDYQGLNEKRAGGSIRTTRIKRTPTGFTARGFHEGVFDRDFGHFSPVKRSQKRKPEADAAGFYGDTFSNGFGEFETMKRDMSPYASLVSW